MRLLSRYSVLICLLGLSSPAWAERTILVYAGTPRGGSGDIAANILMARRLKEARPQDNFIIAVDLDSHHYSFPEGEPTHWAHWKNTRQILAILCPGFNFNRGTQTIDGLTFINSKMEKLPKADYAIGYSMNGLIPQQIRAAATMSIEFSEPGNGSDSGIHEDDSGRFRVGLTAGYSGERLDGSVGGYLRTEPMAPPLSRAELEARLVGKSWLPSWLRGNPYKGKKLAFAYAQRDSEIQKYVDAMGAVASRNPTTQYLAFVKSSAKLDKSRLPSNAEISTINLDFIESEAAIAHADLPVLVTGDISRDFAIEYGKAFAYEANGDSKLGPFHKYGEMQTLAHLIHKTSVGKAFADPASPTSRSRGILNRLLSCEEPPGASHWVGASQADLERLLEDHTLQDNMVAALAEVRQGRSLVGATFWAMDVLDSQASWRRAEDIERVLVRSGLMNDFGQVSSIAISPVGKILQKNPGSVGCAYYISVKGK